MWAGRKGLDAFSLAIEVSGYHDKKPTQAQLAAVRELLRQLQGLYGIPDHRVLTHSMIAYGEPNQFHRHRHRGRKRCGMVFANPDVRRQLGLTEMPSKDPDVTAGRLRIGDRALHRLLYPAKARVSRAHAETRQQAPKVRAEETSSGDVISRKRTAWKIAGPAHASASTIYIFPDGTRERGDTIRRWNDIPPGTRVLLGQTVTETTPGGKTGISSRPGPGKEECSRHAGTISREKTAWKIAGPAYGDASTVYVFPDGTRERGDTIRRWNDIPPGTRVLLSQAIPEPRPADKVAVATPSPPNEGLLVIGQPIAARELLGDMAIAGTTTYLFPSGRVRTGAELDVKAEGRQRLESLPRGTRVLVGYVGVGRVTQGHSPRRVAGDLWNKPNTYYRVPDGAIRTGSEVVHGRVPTGTLVFLPQ
jgi:hypothetical protein